MVEERLDERIKLVLLCIAASDAASNPFEFLDRSEVREIESVTEMAGGGTHGQPPGTYTDDTSLTLCLVDSLCDGYNIVDIGRNFCKWYYTGFWAADGKTIFDIGSATKLSIELLHQGVHPRLTGNTSIYSNGNGSIMRILPLMFFIKDLPTEERYRITSEVSSITHAHPISITACFYYLEYAKLLYELGDKFEAYEAVNKIVPQFLNTIKISEPVLKEFVRIFDGNIFLLPESKIISGGYVVNTLEAALYCFLNYESYETVVERCIRLGNDTDTTSVVAAGLASLIAPGKKSIPEEWLMKLARREEIEELAQRYANSLL